MKETSSIISRITFWSFLVLLIGVGVLTIPSKWAQKRGLECQRDEQLAKINEAKRQIAQYKDWQHRFKTDAEFVEHAARETRLVQAGELVFVFDREKQ